MASHVVMHTAMRVDVRRMISSAGIYLHQVLFMEAFRANQPSEISEPVNVKIFISDTDPATKADDVCFRHANTRGNLFGNCGINGAGQPIKCSVE